MWRQDTPAGLPSVVPRRHRDRPGRKSTGVDIHTGSYENPPLLFAWARTPNAVLDTTASVKLASTTITQQPQDQVRPPSEFIPLAPERVISARPGPVCQPTRMQDKESQASLPSPRNAADRDVKGAACQHTPAALVAEQGVQCNVLDVLQVSPSTSVPSAARHDVALPTKEAGEVRREEAAAPRHRDPMCSNAVQPSATQPKLASSSTPDPRDASPAHTKVHRRHGTDRAADYWKWLHWYSSWQVYYQQQAHPSSRRRHEPNATRPATVLNPPRHHDAKRPPPAAFWVDVKPMSVSDCGPSRPKSHAWARPTQSFPCLNPTFVQTSVARERVVAPMHVLNDLCRKDAVDNDLTLEDLAC
ncbi:hypothetical protein H310_14450 [Aphanomyces invadans]|uniref:Uncharacterized protein n=1 Tax=Aphanomyces invadans TaxID=157072 RepID=A0A024TA30_9STRA|nr:hypothetical protein H310_14450 [Aphanomyces invadans]ETV90854.1 hypothetical protein H310_14450 [Aphanomyces invadans]|eukprot:XP_008880532.1 hypothetical protein H310_14450 [Aphanomyces invadans]